MKLDDFQRKPLALPRFTASPALAVSTLIVLALLHLADPPGATLPAKAEAARQNEAMVTSKTIASFFIVNPPLP